MRLVVGLTAGVAIAAVGYYYYQQQLAAGGHELVLYGNVDVREADLAFNNAGRVQKMLVEEGDPVTPGQLLAMLDPTRFEAEVKTAEGRVAAQKAVLDRLLRGSRAEEIERARQTVKALEAELENDRRTVQRLEKLALDQFAPQQQLDDARTRVRETAAKLEATKQTLSLVVQGPRQEHIDKARADLKAAEGELALARRRLEDTNLFAKNNGWVLTRILEPGEVVLANSPAYTIAISDPVWVRTYVSEPDLGRIYPNMKAEVFTDSATSPTNFGEIYKVQIVPPQPPLCTPPQVAGIERPFGFGGEPVTTPALGDLISVALPTITTPPDGCLAVAGKIYSDNSEEVTGATLNGAETGGWTKTGELLGVTGAPDGGPAVYVAEMPTAGTISGGSVNPNPTTPVSLTFGFFLRGKLV